jgi:caffeoyl-CoA O-methyltransferase
MDGLYHPALTAYLEGLVDRPHPLLLEMEQRAAETNFPIVGPVVGQLFYWLTRLTGARRVFELGSGYGYSTAWFALAMRANGGGDGASHGLGR